MSTNTTALQLAAFLDEKLNIGKNPNALGFLEQLSNLPPSVANGLFECANALHGREDRMKILCLLHADATGQQGYAARVAYPSARAAPPARAAPNTNSPRLCGYGAKCNRIGDDAHKEQFVHLPPGSQCAVPGYPHHFVVASGARYFIIEEDTDGNRDMKMMCFRCISGGECNGDIHAPVYKHHHQDLEGVAWRNDKSHMSLLHPTGDELLAIAAAVPSPPETQGSGDGSSLIIHDNVQDDSSVVEEDDVQDDSSN